MRINVHLYVCICVHVYVCTCVCMCVCICRDVSTCDCASYEWHNMFVNKRWQVQLWSYCRCTGLDVWGTNMTSTSIATEEIQQINSAVQLIRLQVLLMEVMDSVLMTYLLDWLFSEEWFPVHLHTSASRDVACTSWWSFPPTSPGSCDTDPSPAGSSCDSHVTSPITGMLHLLVVEVIFRLIGTQAGRYLGRSLHTVRGVHRRIGERVKSIDSLIPHLNV